VGVAIFTAHGCLVAVAEATVFSLHYEMQGPHLVLIVLYIMLRINNTVEGRTKVTNTFINLSFCFLFLLTLQ
jgi:hypothetical protein